MEGTARRHEEGDRETGSSKVGRAGGLGKGGWGPAEEKGYGGMLRKAGGWEWIASLR